MSWKGTRKPKKPPVYVSNKELPKLLEQMPKPHKLACIFAWAAGLRISEILKLRPENIDFDNGVIHIYNGKGGKDRDVPIPKGIEQRHADMLPFQFKDRALQKMFRQAVDKSGLRKKKPMMRFHSLRHGFAVSCLKKGISLKAIQKMLGHSDLSTTGIYLELTGEDVLNEYMEKF